MQTPERTKELDDFLDQPIDGLLWDLDLLPEQCDSWWKNLVRETIERLAARDAEWQARVDKLEAALKGALREHGSCDWNGCWCQDARAALGREA